MSLHILKCTMPKVNDVIPIIVACSVLWFWYIGVVLQDSFGGTRGDYRA